MLNETPMRGQGVPMPPTDPLIYRFYELVMVNGPALNFSSSSMTNFFSKASSRLSNVVMREFPACRNGPVGCVATGIVDA